MKAWRSSRQAEGFQDVARQAGVAPRDAVDRLQPFGNNLREDVEALDERKKRHPHVQERMQGLRVFDFALEWGIPAVPEADDAALGVELRALAGPQDGEVGRWVEVEVPETVEELLTDAVVKEFRVRTERD